MDLLRLLRNLLRRIVCMSVDKSKDEKKNTVMLMIFGGRKYGMCCTQLERDSTQRPTLYVTVWNELDRYSRIFIITIFRVNIRFDCLILAQNYSKRICHFFEIRIFFLSLECQFLNFFVSSYCDSNNCCIFFFPHQNNKNDECISAIAL